MISVPINYESIHINMRHELENTTALDMLECITCAVILTLVYNYIRDMLCNFQNNCTEKEYKSMPALHIEIHIKSRCQIFLFL